MSILIDIRHVDQISTGHRASVYTALVRPAGTGTKHYNNTTCIAQELCENRGGRPRFPVPNKPHGFRGCKTALTQSAVCSLSQLREARGLMKSVWR